MSEIPNASRNTIFDVSAVDEDLKKCRLFYHDQKYIDSSIRMWQLSRRYLPVLEENGVHSCVSFSPIPYEVIFSFAYMPIETRAFCPHDMLSE